MAIKHTNIFCKTLPILPKLGFLVWKYRALRMKLLTVYRNESKRSDQFVGSNYRKRFFFHSDEFSRVTGSFFLWKDVPLCTLKCLTRKYVCSQAFKVILTLSFMWKSSQYVRPLMQLTRSGICSVVERSLKIVKMHY
jgi:hypothetical protein